MATSPQRAYRAACPNCGAPVEFASAASASAVCGFCRSTLVRDGDALKRIGISSELFDDHSPLQLGAAGRYKGLAFTLVGRLQYGYEGGIWNEWHALFDSGRSGWLSEDNGAYVFAFDGESSTGAPPDAAAAERLAIGQTLTVDGRAWNVASRVSAKLLAAQGELPRPPALDSSFTVLELRSQQDEVGTLDYSDARRVAWSTGRAVLLADLAMSGLREVSEKSLSGRAVECPGCGASLEPKLSSTQSLTCAQCNTVVDVSKGVGGELEHYQQNNVGAGGLEPLIPLGRTGTLNLGTGQAEPWQVVGYMERCDLPAPGDDDEQVYWREYLLYNRSHGFAFLVDSEEDGWSWVRPVTGTPQRLGGDKVSLRGIEYHKRWTYRAKVTWVQGEFYWRVRRDERAHVTDYEGRGGKPGARLSREQTGQEVTWSAGETMAASVVAQAFGIQPSGQAALQRDVAPTGSGMGLAKVIIIILVVLLLVVILSQCGGDRCDSVRQTFGPASAEYQQCQRSSTSSSRTSGGSYGGWSSGGGGHK